MEPGHAREVLPQLRRGALEYCVLALMRREPRYGFELVRELGAADGLLTSEGTIYPLLSRLRKDGLVTTTWQESAAGPPRRYYALTVDGRVALDRFISDWQRFRNSVDRLLGCAAGADPVDVAAHPPEEPGTPSHEATTGPTRGGSR